jgi:hypothetical protein
MEGSMTDDRHRHSPGATSIEPRDKRDEMLERKASDLPREETHIESPGHVERELPNASRGAEGSDGAWPNEGEGNKSADRAYRKATEEFVKSGRVDEQARNAAKALDGSEGQELRSAEDKGRKGKPRAKAR